MSSPIRALLSAAQQAETRGERGEAVRLLTEAASFYQERNMARRAQQMLRQARRLSGDDVEPPALGAETAANFDDDDFDGPAGELDWSEGAPDDFGFGDELLGAEGGLPARSEFERVVTLAEASADAWCSFCCRPQRDVGPLAAGPAGAYVCGGCVSLAQGLLGGTPRAALVAVPVATKSATPQVATPGLTHLPQQARAHQRWSQGRPRLTLVVGPAGAGKSALLRSWGTPRPSTEVVLEGPLALIEVEMPLSAELERRLLRWLDGDSTRQLVVAVRGAVPTPAVVLTGEGGDEAVYTTDAIHQAIAPAVSADFAARVDSVIGLTALQNAELTELARLLATARRLQVGDATLAQLVSLAESSGRGAHELAALLARLPAGRYETP